MKTVVQDFMTNISYIGVFGYVFIVLILDRIDFIEIDLVKIDFEIK